MKPINEMVPDLIRRNGGRKVSVELKAEAYGPPAVDYRAKIHLEQASGSWDHYEAATLEMAHLQACAALNQPEPAEPAAEFDRVAAELAQTDRKEAAA